MIHRRGDPSALTRNERLMFAWLFSSPLTKFQRALHNPPAAEFVQSGFFRVFLDRPAQRAVNHRGSIQDLITNQFRRHICKCEQGIEKWEALPAALAFAS